MQQQLVFGIINALHDLFTAFWIGGLLTSGFAFMPAIKGASDKPGSMKKLLQLYQDKLRVVAVVSIVGLWITGMLMGKQSPAYAGFLNFSTTYNMLLSLKHLIIFVMIAIAVYRGFILGRKIESFNPKQQKLYAALLLINLVLGIVVVFLSGIGSVLG